MPPFYADLHVHSKYSRACSRDCDLEHLAWWARRKGITVLGTGDFTHPAWFEQLQANLVPAEPGLFRLREDLDREVERTLPPSCRRPVRFMLSVEISTIYKRGERTRKIHHLIYVPDMDAAAAVNRRLGRIGNITSDGRPILGLDSRDLLEIALESGAGSYLVPAHVWTPWFAVLGSKSGFDAVEDCYLDLTDHIFALETGLSSDPAMNWRVSKLDRYRLMSNSDAHSPPILGREACLFDTSLDYYAMRAALETGDGYLGTVEFFPEEGKYHLDGHRKCDVRLEPADTRRHRGNCPVCGKPLTVGVLHRVEALADRPEGSQPRGAAGFRCLVPLPEVMGEILRVGPKSKAVSQELAALVDRLGPELDVLTSTPLEEIRRVGSTLLAEAIERLRRGQVIREAGFDGEYGVIRLFEREELERPAGTAALFEASGLEVQSSGRRAREAPPAARDEGEAEPEPTPEPEAGAGAFVEARHAERELLVPSGGAALDPEQRAAAAVVHGPLLIVAGPGTGKTRTLTHRIARLVTEHGVKPEQCLAITFTRRACGEIEERLRSLVPALADRVTATTFHGLGLSVVREQHAALGLDRDFRVADEAERLGLLRGLTGASEREAKAGLLEELSRRRRAASAGPAAGDELLERYGMALRERNLVDFDDLVALPVTLLGADPGLAVHYRERWRWISVDEYQDVDELQYRLLRLLTTPDGNLCAIGDPDQAIYGFRGADVGFFLRFQRDFPGARTVRLRRNYRSSAAIVGGALQAIAPATLVLERALEPVRAEAAAPRIKVHRAPTEAAEAEFVVHSIERLLGGSTFFSFDSGRVEGEGSSDLSFADVAVLYRTDAQAAPLVEALARAGMPFQKRSHERLADLPGVQAILDRLRQLPEDGESGGPGGPGRPGEPGEPGEPGGPSDRSLLGRVRRAAQAVAVEAVAADAAVAAEAADAAGESGAVTAAAAVTAAELLAPLAERCGEDLDRFRAELALGAQVDTWDPRADRVSLLTLHAAKGLEFPVVFLVGCEDGLLPLRFGGAGPRTDQDAAEERRLFFVGMTRARSHLFLSYAARRRRYGTIRETTPSPFLADIDEALLEQLFGTQPPKRPSKPVGDQLSLL
jgi:DNA helicase-2/ATP-dependent DNA helicase PcrA